MVMSRRRLLMGGTAATLGGLAAGRMLGSAHAGPSATARNLVLVVASGGWDVTYALDPKPGLASIDAPGGEVQMFGDLPIFVDPSRPTVTELFTAWADQAVVVNGIGVHSISHDDCTRRMLTGTVSDRNPDFGTMVAWTHGRELPAPYLVLGRTSYAGPHASICARTGTANQIGTLLDPFAAFPVVGEDLLRFAPDAHESELIRDHVEARAAREQAIRGQVGSNKRRLEDFLSSMRRGDDLLDIGSLGEFDFTRDVHVQVDLAISALERGISHVVQIEVGDWDTHDDNARQVEKHEELFGGLVRLLDGLAATPGKATGARLLDETVVAVVSEMSRTPKLNPAGGKDHWPSTSALVLGAGVAGGRVLGATDDLAAPVKVDLATGRPDGAAQHLDYDNFVAGVLNLVGVDAAEHLPGSEPLDALQA
jgi:uncharacterized protein (DUF1501 family)